MEGEREKERERKRETEERSVRLETGEQEKECWNGAKAAKTNRKERQKEGEEARWTGLNRQ